ncbi:hypothetical protein F4859DRAFT_336890 [Xylaria cf. heliscus]|nr:hypothetical protein F4859DRAFT_336890 [Xylaria cf. heliscus]
MMASIGPGFHPGMPQHPVVHPGHAIGAPGMAHTPSQPGAQQGIPPQMAAHLAASGPGGQINPSAMMGGMPQGAAGPNAHALQHLNPQMFQQQQHYMATQNPNAAQNVYNIQQQRIMQARQAGIMQHQIMGGMPMMNAQQFAQLRQGMQPRMPGHMPQGHLQQGGQHPTAQHQQLALQQMAIQQHQQQQQQQQHQAQQAANNAMHQGGQPGHPGHMTPHQLQTLQQQQQNQLAQSMAQQMPATVAQNQQPQPQPQPQPPPQPQGQPQQPQPPQPQQQGQQQQGQHQAQQASAGPQGPQRAATPAGGQTNQPQAQGPTVTQANQPQQPQPQQQQQQQAQAQNQSANQPQQPNAQLLQQQQFHLQMQAQQQAQQQHHKNDNMMKGQCLLKLMQFSEHLSNFPGTKGRDDVQYWQMFVDRFFSHRGIFRLSLPVTGSDSSNDEHGPDKQYEIVQPALARYFHTHFQSGIHQIQLTFERGTSDRQLTNGCHFLENPRASMIYWFENSHVVATGQLKAQFDSEQKLEMLEFNTQSHEEYVSRKMVINAARPTHMWAKEWKKVNGQDANASPEMSKKGKAKQLKSPPNAPPDFVIPHSAVKGNMGITESVFQFLEIVEVMGQMNPLFGYYQAHSSLSPYQALEQYVNTHITNGLPQATMNGHASGAIPPNQRTPSFSQFPLGASPAASHLQLPNSPHMGSPAQGHMQAPGMQLQQSAQGTNSSGPSANTSPASNKRRRPSAVKAEEDGGAPTPASLGAPQVNGVATKKPPTPRLAHNSKRQKVNPA